MTFADIVGKVNSFAWGPIMLVLLVGTGVYLSVRVGFIQFTRLGYWMKNTFGKIFKKHEAGEGEVTSTGERVSDGSFLSSKNKSKADFLATRSVDEFMEEQFPGQDTSERE